jgi:hypothetical protein
MSGFNKSSTLKLNININQGADFNLVFTVTDMNGPVDLIGYEFLGEMKKNTDEHNPVAEFVFTILNQYLYPGQVQWSLPACASDDIMTSDANSFQRMRRNTPFLYDVKMKDTSGNVSRILQGTAFVSPEVTQECFP